MTTTMTQLEYAKSYAAASRIPESFLTMGGLVDLLERIDELKAEVVNLNEGARMLHSLATGGASRFDGSVDVQQAHDWQDEADPIARARAIALPNGQLRSYASYNTASAGKPLSADEVDMDVEADDHWYHDNPNY